MFRAITAYVIIPFMVICAAAVGSHAGVCVCVSGCALK